MLKKKKNNNHEEISRHCPFLNDKCLGEECELYHANFKKCALQVLTHNLWVLSESLKKYAE